MTSATHKDVMTNVHPVTFDILGGPAPMTGNAPLTAGAELASQQLVLLIGRDLLSRAHFTYNGIAGDFTICF